MREPEYLNALLEVCNRLSSNNSASLPLCAAENIVSPFSKVPLDSFLQEKYIMGGVIKYDSHNNFAGSIDLFDIYKILSAQCEKLFRCRYADARTLSGVNAVTTLLMSLFASGDRILISSEDCGGHGSMPKICHRLGIKTMNLPYNYNTFDFDYDMINKILYSENIDGILICQSDIIKMPNIEKITLPDNCTLIFDATQILGLIASGTLYNPFDYFDVNDNFIMLGATHKTIPGPTCGLIMTNNTELAKKFDTQINPDYLRNNQLHHIVSLILALMEIEVFGYEYSCKIVENANSLARFMTDADFSVLKSDELYTHTHQIFVSMNEIEASTFFKSCEKVGITLNLRKRPIYRECGIRIGTQQVSRFGWGKDEMREIASILKNVRLEQPFDILVQKISQLEKKKSLKYTYTKDIYDKVYHSLHYS